MLLLATPPLITWIIIAHESQELDIVQDRFCWAMNKAQAALDRKMRKERFLERYSPSDPYFLDMQVESPVFLEEEKNQLTKWLAHPALTEKRSLLERLEFLDSEENTLCFTEEEIQFSNAWKETLEKQKRSIQIDNNDLKKLLTLIEDIPISGSLSKSQRPQLIITDFTLQKIQTPLQNEVFELNIELLKREFL